MCERILLTQPRHAGALLLRGVIDLESHRTTSATAWIRESMSSDPARPVAYVVLGDALLEMGSAQEALDAYDAALSQHPNLEPAHFGRGNAPVGRRMGNA